MCTKDQTDGVLWTGTSRNSAPSQWYFFCVHTCSMTNSEQFQKYFNILWIFLFRRTTLSWRIYAIKEEVIAITISINFIRSEISNWRISDETFISDYRYKTNYWTKQKYRQLKAADWLLYQAILVAKPAEHRTSKQFWKQPMILC